jgi:hypothetical protein
MRDLHAFLSNDHDRLDALLTAALRPDGFVDRESFAEFRRGLLTHIGIEEKILFPEMRRRRGASPLEEQLHRDHALLAALLVLAPTPPVIEEIRSILAQHNPLEESEGGMYDIVEQLTGEELDAILARAQAYPPVRTAPYSDSTVLREAIDRLRREADEGRAKLR